MSTVVSTLLNEKKPVAKFFAEGMIIRINKPFDKMLGDMEQGVYVLLQTESGTGQFFCIGNTMVGRPVLDTNRYNSAKYSLGSQLPKWMTEFVIADSSSGLELA